MRVEHEQQTSAWHEWRAGGIGASDASTMLGLNEYCTPHQYWLRRTHRAAPQASSPAMRHGIEQEENARALWNAIHTEVHPACYQHDEHAFMRASLDGISADGSLVVDFKTPQAKNWDLAYNDAIIPASWRLQVQAQMLISGADTGFVCVYSDKHKMVVPFEVFRDERIEAELIAAYGAMWACIQTDTPPELTELDLEYKALANELLYDELCEEELRIKAKKDAIRDSWIKLAGDCGFRSDLFAVTKRVTNRVDYKKYCEELDPEGAHKGDFVRQSQSWTVRRLQRR